jgi:hypothetical protein
MSSFESYDYEDLYHKYINLVQINLNPNNTNKATVNVNVNQFDPIKYKNTESQIIALTTSFVNIIKENNMRYNNLGTVSINLKKVSRKNFSVSYFSKVYKVLDTIFPEDDIVDKIICLCDSGIPAVIWKFIKPILDPITAKKFVFYKL